MKKLFIFGLLNLLVVFGSLIVGMYTHVAARRYFAPDVIYIAPMLNESHLHWSIDDIDALQRQYRDYSISAESRGNVFISSSTNQASTTVVYTDAAYFSTHFMDFIEGNRWLEDANAIVLNQTLAWRLFGSGNIVGQAVVINHRPYIVTGVVRQGSHVAGEYLAWKPRNASPAPLPVTALYIRANNYNLVDVAVYTREMLTRQQRNPANYAIVDINRYIEAIGLRNRIFLYILWLSILIAMVRVCMRKHYKFNSRVILGYIPPVVGVLLASHILYSGVNDILYWLPNLSIPGTSVIDSITNANLLPPDGYLSFGLYRMSYLNRIGNVAWIVGAIAFINTIVCTTVMRGDVT